MIIQLRARIVGLAATVVLASFSQAAWCADAYPIGSLDSSLGRINQIEAELTALKQEFDMMQSGAGTDACGCDACQAGGYSCCSAVRCGWSLEFENFVWRARRAGMPYAGDATLLPGAGDPGLLGSSRSMVDAATKFGNDWGFRMGLRYVAANTWELGAEYSYFRTNGASQYGSIGSNLDNVHANFLERSLADDLLLNGLFDDGLVDFASERIALQYDVVDVHIGRSLCVAPGFVVRPFVGLRLAWINQQADIVYQNVEPIPEQDPLGDLDTANILTAVSMDAGGLRIGTESYWSPCRGSVSLFSRVALSMLYAEFRTRRTDDYFNQSTATRGIRTFSSGFETVVPVLELAAGVRYDRGPFFLQTGYEFANWFNLNQQVQALGFDDIDGSTVAYRFDGGDLSLDGWFLRAGIIR